MSTVKPQFVDVFAGAGGLSLGLLNAGWTGLFAIEKSPMAFETLKYNLIDKEEGPRFEWPSWFPCESIGIEAFLETYQDQLQGLRGLPLLAGGPPCQGFSMAGRRRANDERNRLFERYLDLVDAIQPKMLLIENVVGFAIPFKKTERDAEGAQVDQENFDAAKQLSKRLDALGYTSFVPPRMLMAKDFGVPQLRPRYIHIAILKEFLSNSPDINPFDILTGLNAPFLQSSGLPVDREITVREAISDLEKAHGCIPCIEPGMAKFWQGKYGPVESEYQEIMRGLGSDSSIPTGQVADSHRFPNHRKHTLERFKQIIDRYRPGINLSNTEREEMKINKHCIAFLAANEACHTLTCLPDDLVHYCEPRVLTVREYARIQSFPDWFKFRSTYTTGSSQRRVQVPRYTQAANAVPPLMAQALGFALLKVYGELLQAALSMLAAEAAIL